MNRGKLFSNTIHQQTSIQKSKTYNVYNNIVSDRVVDIIKLVELNGFLFRKVEINLHTKDNEYGNNNNKS